MTIESDRTARARDLVAAMTLEEKVSLCSGADFWNTKGIERLGIRPFMLTDGPHGLRKQASDADHLGLNESVPATCFPPGAGLGSTWNPPLIRAIGEALGREARTEQVGVLLGPAINIKRHPLGGRSFEYLSEDPFLTGTLAAAYIDGVQSEGVGTSLKHFAVNNQEKNRLLIDVVVDQRTLRELYLRAFEIAVTAARPWTVMTAYNRVNGVYASDNRWLMTDVLREQWGFTGVVVTDWGAEDDRVAGVLAGTSLEMPGNGGLGDREIMAAVRDGRIEESLLDMLVVDIVDLHLRVEQALERPAGYDAAAHHALARRAAAEATVLLRNEGGVLPISPGATVAVLGAFAEDPRYQGGGSSHIAPTRLDTLLGTLAAEHPDLAVSYAAGYLVGDPRPDAALLAEASALAADADVTVVLVGLTDQEESEGYDRTHLRLSDSHLALVEAALAASGSVVVALSNGAPVEMPFADRAAAIVESYLGGQAGGSALADVLTGAAEPSGRLAETFPHRLEDTPAYLNYPGSSTTVEYREGVHVGYRYYDAVGASPLYPFGYGLSYTTIAIEDVRAEEDGDSVVLHATARNTGARPGSEVVQVYVHQRGAQPARPEQELVAFEKIDLQPGEARALTFSLDRRAFSYWGEHRGDWTIDTATFDVLVGRSSRDIAGRASVDLVGAGDPPPSQGQNTALGSLLDHPVLGPWARALREVFRGGQGTYDPESPEALLVDAFSRELPLRSLVKIGALITQEDLERAVRVIDGTADTADLEAFTRS